MKLGSSRAMDTKRPRGSERSKPRHELQLTRRSQPPYPWPPEQAQPGVSKPCRTTGLFVYRQVLADPSSHERQPWAIVGSLSSIALMQISYWVSYRVRPPLPQLQNALLGHVILFLARM